jgi:flagellar basal-body rod modification protein FlgD
MAIPATNGVGGGAADGSARTRLASNFDTFLTLLTTQLKNQDPLSPMDSNDFTQQMVQMTGVEQQLLTNDLLKQLVGNTATGISAAVSLIGKDVRAVSDTAMLADGEAKWTYRLDRDAADVKVEVLDANGKTVHAFAPTDNKAGDHKFTWDGKTASGGALPDGVYTLKITAVDTANVTVPSTTYVEGIVTGVEQAEGKTLITINGGTVLWDRVTTINQPPPPTAANGSTDPDADPSTTDDQTSSVAGA